MLTIVVDFDSYMKDVVREFYANIDDMNEYDNGLTRVLVWGYMYEFKRSHLNSSIICFCLRMWSLHLIHQLFKH